MIGSALPQLGMIPLDLGGWAARLVDGTMIIALPVALLAGLVSFFSPCVVPLLPGYVSYATGLGAADVVAGRGRRGIMLAGMLLFVLGFAAVFVATAALLGGVGGLMVRWEPVITRVMGVVMIMLGLIFAQVLPIGRRELRLSIAPRVGIAAAPLLGIVFGLGWTPCLGPTLGAVYTLALNAGTAARGGALAFSYAVGLGVPFVIAGLAFTRLNRAVKFLRTRQKWIMRIGGLLMIIVGILMVTGLWAHATGQLRQLISGFETVI